MPITPTSFSASPTVSWIRADLLPNSRRNKLNRNIPNEKRRPQYPAVLVGQLAVSEDYKGLHIGDELLDAIKSWFIEPLNKTGCRYVVVDALNHSKVFDFYQAQRLQVPVRHGGRGMDVPARQADGERGNSHAAHAHPADVFRPDTAAHRITRQKQQIISLP